MNWPLLTVFFSKGDCRYSLLLCSSTFTMKIFGQKNDAWGRRPRVYTGGVAYGTGEVVLQTRLLPTHGVCDYKGSSPEKKTVVPQATALRDDPTPTPLGVGWGRFCRCGNLGNCDTPAVVDYLGTRAFMCISGPSVGVGLDRGFATSLWCCNFPSEKVGPTDFPKWFHTYHKNCGSY
jgi:hypothetical protein